MRFVLTVKVCLLTLLAVSAACRDAQPGQSANQVHYVAPDGSPEGDGSSEQPWDIATALDHPALVRPGDTIWLRGGSYSGTFLSNLAGEESHPVILRQYPGERATIDGGLEIRGQYATYWGFEVMNSDPDRDAAAPGAEPADYTRPVGLVVHGPGTRLINLVVHDAREGIGLWSTAVDAEVYGSLVYNNGWQGPDRGYGNGISAQNKIGTKRIEDNIIFQHYNVGLNVYGSSAASLSGFHVEGNVVFNNGTLARQPNSFDIFIGGGSAAERISITHNYLYRQDGLVTARLGYEPGVINHDLTLTDNYFGSQTQMVNWQSATVAGNTFTGAQNLVDVRVPPGLGIRSYDWHTNTYLPDKRRRALNSNAQFLVFENGRGQGYDYPGWVEATGHDGRASTSASRPTGVSVFVRPNRYESGRAHIIVYNWDHAPTVEVDVSDVLRRGDQFELRSVQDYFGVPLQAGTYAGRRLRLPFTRDPPLIVTLGATASARPVGFERSPAPNTAPEFNVFVLTRVNPVTQN